MTLPPSIQRLFYRYRADRPDTERHAAIIILADGSANDWEWLFQVYGWNAVQAWIAAPGHAMMLCPWNGFGH